MASSSDTLPSGAGRTVLETEEPRGLGRDDVSVGVPPGLLPDLSRYLDQGIALLILDAVEGKHDADVGNVRRDQASLQPADLAGRAVQVLGRTPTPAGRAAPGETS